METTWRQSKFKMSSQIAKGFTQPEQEQEQEQEQQQQQQELLDDHFTFFDLFLPCTIYDVLTSWWQMTQRPRVENDGSWLT